MPGGRPSHHRRVMPTPHFVARPPDSTPAELRSSRRSHRALPPDLLREASLRLGIISLIGAGLWFFGPALGHVARAATDRSGKYRWYTPELPMDVIAVTSIAV